MPEKLFKNITNRIIKEQPQFGSIKLSFFFHNGEFVKYEFDKTDITLIEKENKTMEEKNE